MGIHKFMKNGMEWNGMVILAAEAVRESSCIRLSQRQDFCGVNTCFQECDFLWGCRSLAYLLSWMLFDLNKNCERVLHMT